MQFRLGGSFVVCLEAFFLSDRRANVFFRRETNVSDKRVIWLLRLDRARGAETGLLEKRPLAGAQAPSAERPRRRRAGGQEPGGEEPEEASHEGV